MTASLYMLIVVASDMVNYGLPGFPMQTQWRDAGSRGAKFRCSGFSSIKAADWTVLSGAPPPPLHARGYLVRVPFEPLENVGGGVGVVTVERHGVSVLYWFGWWRWVATCRWF